MNQVFLKVIAKDLHKNKMNKMIVNLINHMVFKNKKRRNKIENT